MALSLQKSNCREICKPNTEYGWGNPESTYGRKSQIGDIKVWQKHKVKKQCFITILTGIEIPAKLNLQALVSSPNSPTRTGSSRLRLARWNSTRRLPPAAFRATPLGLSGGPLFGGVELGGGLKRGSESLQASDW